MAAKTAAPPRARSGEPYWERIDPAEFEYAEGDFEIRAYDDRSGPTEDLHVQFHRVSSRGRRVATFDVQDLSELQELVHDLQGLHDQLAGGDAALAVAQRGGGA